MAYKILIIGDSGSGKSTSLKTLDEKETFIINVIGKPLPFKNWRTKYQDYNREEKIGNMIKIHGSEAIINCMQHVNINMPHVKLLVIDDTQYIMSYEFMERAGEKGWDKFTEIGQHMFNVLILPDSLRDDLKVVFLAHTDDSTGRTKMKTIGKMLDEKITLEGLFTTVLLAVTYKEDELMKHAFVTETNGTNVVKTPDGMFNDKIIPNDLNLVIQKVDEYNG